jgi:hypothetical protein
LALKPLKPSKANRKGGKRQPSVEQQAQKWVSQWQLEEQRRRKAEESMGSVSWRQPQALDLNKLVPLLRQRVLQLLA